MDETEQVSHLIGDIYAALDPALWSSVFDKVCDYVGVAQASLISQDSVRKTADLYFVSSHDPRFRQLYFQSYFRINPLFPTVVFFDVERTLSIQDVVPRDEFCRTKFSREWLAPQGFVDSIFSIVEKWTTGCTLFYAIRHGRQGLADDETRRRFALIIPHVRRSLLIGRVIDLHKVEAATLADSLDNLAAGMFIVDTNGRTVHSNTSGHVMIAEANVLRAPSGRLVAFDPPADRVLLKIFAAAAGGDAAVGRNGIAVPLEGRDGERHVAHVLPLTSGARRKAGISYTAAAVGFVRKATLNLPSPLESLAHLYKLTPAELRVLVAIVEIGGVALHLNGVCLKLCARWAGEAATFGRAGVRCLRDRTLLA